MIHSVGNTTFAIVAGAVWAIAAGCVEGPTSRVRPSDLPERHYRAVAWDTVMHVEGSLQDTVLLGSSQIAADPEGVAVLDSYRNAVVRFATDGSPVWSFGRSGRGPNELMRPIAIEIDGQGRHWVLDDTNARITVLERTGEPAFRIPLQSLEQAPIGMAVLQDGSVVLSAMADPPFLRIDTDGRLLERFAVPDGDLDGVDPMARQLNIAADRSNRRWIGTLFMMDGFYAFDPQSPEGRVGWYVEPVPAPLVEITRDGAYRSKSLVDHTVAALAAEISDGRMYVLFQGRTRERGRILDIYDVETGGYQESLLLPMAAFDLSLGGDVVYLAYEDPYPSLIGLRPVDPADE